MPDLLERAESLLRIGRDIYEHRGLRINIDVMNNTDRKVRSHVFIVTHDFRIGSARELVANEIMKAWFGTGYDQLNCHKTYCVSGSIPLSIGTVVENVGTWTGGNPRFVKKRLNWYALEFPAPMLTVTESGTHCPHDPAQETGSLICVSGLCVQYWI